MFARSDTNDDSHMLRWLLLASIAAEAQAATPIQRIEHQLLPPVLVKGEPVPQSKLSDRMAELHVPGVSIAVLHAGKIEWARGFGVVRLGGPPVTPETLFQAASISKPTSTLAILRLVQAGKLNLDTDINQYLTSWKLPSNEFTQQSPVTLRKLLTHSAGVTVHGFAGYPANTPLPTVVQILNGEPPANNPPIRVDIPPGRQWRYSGGGFEIAQQAVTDVTGIPFAKLMHDTVLQPLGMQHSTYEQPAPATFLTHAATPYRGDGTPVPGGPHVYPELAAAGLWTTPSDLARLAIGVQKSLSGAPGAILPVGTAHAMLAPVINQQALGFQVGGHPPNEYFTHGGSNEGYRCSLVAYRNGDGAVVMTSGDNGSDLVNEVVRTIAYEYHWPDFLPAERTLTAAAPETFDPHVGAYRFANGVLVTFWRDNQHLESRIEGQGPVELFPTSDREYFTKLVDARWGFQSNATTLYQNGIEQSATRLNGPEAQKAVDYSIALQKRISAQTPAPNSEAILRRLIEGLASGHPDYEDLGPGLAQLTRAELPALQKAVAAGGPVQTITFKGVSPGGADLYQVQFEHSFREFRIVVESDGRIHSAWFSD
jgi:CubicO group peptidase (beta-lactamase class C family)